MNVYLKSTFISNRNIKLKYYIELFRNNQFIVYHCTIFIYILLYNRVYLGIVLYITISSQIRIILIYKLVLLLFIL